MSFSRFRPRRGTSLQWETANTLLNEGEIGFEFANRIGDGEAKVKIGDGARRWNDLPYAINTDDLKNALLELSQDYDDLSELNDELTQRVGDLETDNSNLIQRVGELENDTGWVLLTKTSTSDYTFNNNAGVYYRKKSGVLYIRGLISTIKSVSSVLTTLPGDARPLVSTPFSAVGSSYSNTNKDYNGYLKGTVANDGRIMLGDVYGELTRIDDVTFNVAIPL